MSRAGRSTTYTLLIIVWAVGFSLAVWLSPRRISISLPQTLDPETAFQLPQNQAGLCSLTLPPGIENPGLQIAFDSLRVENSHLGIFKTALHQAARVENLQLALYQQSQPSAGPLQIIASALNPDRDNVPPTVAAKDLLKNLRQSDSALTVNSIDLTRANISELTIDHFSCDLHNADGMVTITSRRALTSHDKPELTLRGMVTIKAQKHNSQNLLRANHIDWDINDNIFIVKGVYILTRDGKTNAGKDIALNFDLSEISHKAVKNYHTGVEKCFARSQF